MSSLPSVPDLLQTEFDTNAERVAMALQFMAENVQRLEVWLSIHTAHYSTTAGEQITEAPSPSSAAPIPAGALPVHEDDAIGTLKRHIADESAEAVSGIQYLTEVLQAQWFLTGIEEVALLCPVGVAFFFQRAPAGW